MKPVLLSRFGGGTGFFILSNIMTIKSTCPYCGVGCGITIEQQTNHISIIGDNKHPANYGKLCVKGSNLADTLGKHDRLTEPSIDGQGTSWDVAIAKISSAISQSVAKYGPDSVAMYLSGQLLTEDYYVANKFMKGYIGTANVDTNSRLCMASSVVGHKRAFGEDLVPGNYTDFDAAELIVFVGSNAAWNHPIIYQRICQAKNRNPDLKVVVIDPKQTATADIADLHLAIRPGSDSLLFNALLAYIADSTSFNQAYVDQFTNGFEQALTAAQEDISDQADLLTKLDITATDLQDFLELFARYDKTITLYSQGINQSSSGSDKVNAILNCHLATGRIGKPGMGPLSLTGQPNAMGGREVGGLANQLAAHEDFSDPVGIQRIEEFWQAPNIAKTEGAKAVDLFHALETGAIKIVWIMGTNPVVSMPNANQIKRALAKADLVIVSESMASTDTLDYADIVLPASTWSEKQGTVTNSDRLISRQRGFIPPPGQAKHDWWAIAEVARHMGFAEAFDFTSPADIFREHAALSGFKNNGRRLFDISALATLTDAQYESLTPLRWPVNSAHPNGCDRILNNGIFPTPDSRARFLSISHRQPEQPPNKAMPFILNTGRIRDQWHTMTRTGRAAKLMQHRREPFVDINPTDAKKISIKEGQLLCLQHQSQGTIVVRAHLDKGQRQGELFVPMHWTDRFASNARINQLIEPKTDPFSGQPESKQGRVAIQPFRAKVYGTLVTDKPLTDDQLAHFTYWSKAPLPQHFIYYFASESRADELHQWSEEILGHPTIAAGDGLSGDQRYAWIKDKQLQSLMVVAKEDALPDMAWIEEILLAPINSENRSNILALKPATGVDAGPVICSCFQVRKAQINSAIENGCKSLEALQAKLKCGTNCGSCLPEVKGLFNP
jgi:assimilatory nitrate reductase catalytic subunit